MNRLMENINLSRYDARNLLKAGWAVRTITASVMLMLAVLAPVHLTQALASPLAEDESLAAVVELADLADERQQGSSRQSRRRQADVLAAELLAKVSSLLRRYQEYRGKPASSVWSYGSLEVDLGTRMVRNGGEIVPLTDTEYSILECLVKNRGRTVTTQELYETVWNEKFLPGSGNTIMVHVLNLRRKIEEVPSAPKIIRTVWGRGYQVD